MRISISYSISYSLLVYAGTSSHRYKQATDLVFAFYRESQRSNQSINQSIAEYLNSQLNTTTMVAPSLQTSFSSTSSSASSSKRAIRPPLSPSATASVQVVIRVRPLNNREKKHGTLPVISASTSDKTVTVIKGSGSKQVKSKYKFDNVFTSFSTQEDVFEATLQPIIRDVLNGYESTVFAYGQVSFIRMFLMLFWVCCCHFIFITQSIIIYSFYLCSDGYGENTYNGGGFIECSGARGDSSIGGCHIRDTETGSRLPFVDCLL